MATEHSFSKGDLSCPVCREIFRDPLVLLCSHSVCKTCLQQFWETKRSKICPVCEQQSMDNPTVNLVLKNLCEAFLTRGSNRASAECEEFCSLHNEKLKLFCMEDQQPVCVVCHLSQSHRKHECRPIDEVVSIIKNKLTTMLKPLQKALNVLEDIKQGYDKTAAHIKNQAQHTEQQIKKAFEKLHQFLRDEEAARIAVLKEEEEQKSLMMRRKIEEISGEIQSLSGKIRNIEKEMKAKDIPFVKNMEFTMKQVEFTPRIPEKASGALIHAAKHLSNLKFRVWKKMLEILQACSVSPITLDPNTVHPNLHLSDDLTAVEYRQQKLQLPDNPERFDKKYCVLGAEGFDSGTHCWDVEVGQSEFYTLGLIKESEVRKAESFWDAVCSISYDNLNDKYWILCPGQPAHYITPTKKLQRIRVQLDWDGGNVTFSDPLTSTHLHTITHTFTERVLPLLGNGRAACSLRILPYKTSITVR